MTKKRWLVLWLLPIAGLLSLIWFLVRVIPKPSRAMYPCQRVAFPLASGFIVWLLGAAGSIVAIRKAKRSLVRSCYIVAAICVAVSIGAIWIAVSITSQKAVLATPPVANAPIGVAKGIHPGRVVWVHDPNATDWQGVGDGHWWETEHTNQAVVEDMLSETIHELADENNDANAWDTLFRYFNQTHGNGDTGYQPGEKIAIKVNMVHFIERGGHVDPNTYNIIDHKDYMNATPQMMLALLKQLVNVVGMDQADISIGDPTTYFPNEFYNVCHDVFPDVNYIDVAGGNEQHPRTSIEEDFSTPIYWSSHPDMNDYTQDYILTCYTEADYIINMSNFKSHDWATVTFCGKNLYGCFIRYPGQDEDDYYNWHPSLPYNTFEQPYTPNMGSYRVIVDMMGHPHLGGKTMLFLIDGLWAGQHMRDPWPLKLYADPFNGDWSSSIFASQDPVAIDSVAYDILWAEPNWVSPTHLAAGDDYLHEAAEANNPASGVFYDPINEHNIVRLDSLGTHEHWNNAIDRQYSRNLETGDGIELVMISSLPPQYLGDLDDDHDVDINDLSILIEHWLGRGLLRPELVVLEAEHYDSNDPGSGSAAGSSWVQLTGAGSMGDGYMQALPDAGLNINDPIIESDSPHLSYQINFNTTAPDVNYYLWVKGHADNPLANCLHYGLDGTSVSFDNKSAPQLNQSTGFTWISENKDGSRPFVTIPSAGTHTLEVWMREDGAQIDRLLLTTDVNYDPTEQAPEEGTHQLTNIIGDLNTDDQVNMYDIAILAQDWLKGVGP